MAAITRLSLDGYGTRRTGNFAGKEASTVVVVEPQAEEERQRTFGVGYIPPKRKRRKKIQPAVVELAVENHEVKSVSVQQVPVEMPSVAPIMDEVQKLARLIEANAKQSAIQAAIEEAEEEEDILFIVRNLH